MKSSRLLQIAAVIALLQFVTHTAMFVTYHPSHGVVEMSVVAAMRDNAFAFSGVQRSYWDMYFGYGLFSAFACALEATVFWYLSRLAVHAPALVFPFVEIFFVANVVYAALIWMYFFPLPGYFDVLLAALMVLAGIALRRESRAR